MAKKPTGFTGSLLIGRNSEGVFAKLNPIQWPSDQASIELKILGMFIREFERSGARILGVQPGGTKELDFKLKLPGGDCYLELAEVVLPNTKEVPFQAGNRSFGAIEYANAVYSMVERKTRKYGLRNEIPIDLLLYTTHSQYAPAEPGVLALRRVLLEQPHSFHYVFMLCCLPEDGAVLQVLFNKDHPLSAPPLEELKDARWISFDITKGTVTHKAGIDITAAGQRWYPVPGRQGWW